MENTPKEKPRGAGRSSFSLIDPERVFGQLRLKRGSTFLDMASGRGEYAIAASKVIGEKGLVYAIDLWDVERVVTPHGFRKERVIDVGPHNYLITFDFCAIT